MFGKGKEDERLETVLGPETHFQGTMRSKGAIRVDGRVEGGISAEGVVVGETGQVQGDITAKNVVIGGKVTGNITAAGTLELQHHSQVFGDVRTSQLAIAEGAVFEGNCVMTTDKAKVIEMDEVMSKGGSR
jgi:cytoskeletal protein CcmA (bactofilin family)